MTTPDREQIRQMAEALISEVARLDGISVNVSPASASIIGEGCLALLDALEQAERERDDQRLQAGVYAELIGEQQTRLATVPALVEAAERAARKMKREYDLAYEQEVGRTPPEDECWAETEALTDALLAYQETTK